MGNGVGVESKRKRSFTSDFNQLEKLCKNGFFYENHDQYVMKTQQAIQWDAIDCLELLIISGNVKKLQPLHQAAKLGKLESVEILLSAGFSGDSTDKDGRTPLHLCCLIHTEESALCACLLGLWYPKSVEKYDRAGYVPIHIAAMNDNTIVANALVKVCANCLSKRATSGKSVYELAKENNCPKMLEWWEDQQQAKCSKSSKNAKNKGKPHDEVSNEKIMEIWEKFFENAFKRAGVEYDDCEDDLLPAPQLAKSMKPTPSSTSNKALAITNYNSSSTKKSSSSKVSSKSKSKNKVDEDLWDQYYTRNDDKNNDYDNYDNYNNYQNVDDKADYKGDYKSSNYYCNDEYDEACQSYNDTTRLEWFDWLVYYDESENAYAIIQISSYPPQFQWLEEFLADLRTTDSYLFLQATEEVVASWPYPANLTELIHSGWMSYYDLSTNRCLWLNVITSHCEEYLPIGLSETPEVLLSLYRFQPYYYQQVEDDVAYDGDYGDQNKWMTAEQEATKAWIMVILPQDDKDDDDGDEQQQQAHYYLHQWTRQTSWTSPPGWEDLVAVDWQGWLCCCMESDPDALFWYDPDSGTSSWGE